MTGVTSNAETQVPPATLPADALLPPRPAPRAQPLLVLSQDAELLATLAAVTNPVHEVCAAGSEIDFAAALLTHHAGVAVLDCAALATQAPDLARRLRAQFPELVLIAAGRISDQELLAAEITDGTVHRFLHKPLSEQRVRLFVDAAWRRHGAARPPTETAAPSPPRSRRATRVLAAVLLTAILARPFLWNAVHSPGSSPQGRGESSAAGHTAGSDAELEGLLARAQRALNAGQLTSPAGASAAELYRAALRRSARDPRAMNGLEQVIEQLLGSAEAQLQQGELGAARELTAQAHAINPDHPRVAFVMGEVSALRERAMLGKAQRAAAAGNMAAALAVLDDAARSGHSSTLTDEARAEFTRKQFDARVADFLSRARDALGHGRLIAPAEDNARYYIDAARALAPDDGLVQQAGQELIARLESEARQALTARNWQAAEGWIAAAADTGADPVRVAALREQVLALRGGVAAVAPAPQVAPTAANASNSRVRP